jgi:hypothetical protein
VTGQVRFRGGFGVAESLDRAELIRELAEVRRRGIVRVESPNPRLQARGLPLLRHVSSAYGGSGQSFTRQLEQLIRASIARLPEGLARQTAETIFGLHDDLFAPKPDAWRQQAAALYDLMSLEVFRKGPELEVLGLMAAEIEALVPGAFRDTPAAVNPHYVPRQSLQREFDQLVTSGAKLIALVGQPGMGKSWLAQKLVGIDPSTGIARPRIRIEAGSIVSQDVDSVLSLHGITDIPTDSRKGLARLLCDERGPDMVVLDDLESTAQLHDLLPPVTRSTVIATCRRQERVPGHCQLVQVGAMEPAEAVLMAQQRIPALSNADAELLAVTTLHRYPLLINHACTLLASRGVTVAQFCDDITQDATGFAQLVDVGPEGKLYAVLAGLLDQVEARDPLAYDLLRYISSSNLLPFISRDYLRRCMTVGHEPPASATAFAQALTVLRDMALIELHDASDEMAWLPTGYVAMHPYTQLVLQQLSSRRRGFRNVTECFLKVHKYYRDHEPPQMIGDASTDAELPLTPEAREWMYSKWLAEINWAICLTVNLLEKAWRNRTLGWLIVFDIASFKASLERLRRLLNEYRDALPPGWPEFAWQRMRELIAPRLAEVRELPWVSIDDAVLQL